MKRSGIYAIVCLIKDGIYIGQSVWISRRWNQEKHFLRKEKTKYVNSHLLRAWNKYGKENFEFRILEECCDEMLDIREKAWIKYYRDAGKNVYNFTDGGQLNQKMNDETKEKISKALSSFYKTHVMHHKGKKCPKISIANMGRKQTPEWKEKCRLAKIGKRQYCRKIEKLNKDGTVIKRYNALIDAARELGKNNSTPIQLACRDGKQSYGFLWRYV